MTEETQRPRPGDLELGAGTATPLGAGGAGCGALPLRSLFGAVCALWTTGLAFLAVPSAAQPCGNVEGGCRIHITATSSQPFQVGARVVFTLTVQNTGTLDLKRVGIVSHRADGLRPEASACAVDNSRWNRPEGNLLSWSLRLGGELRPGEKLTVPFCVEVVDPPHCSTAQIFWVYATHSSDTVTTTIGAEAVARVQNAACTPNPCPSGGGAEAGAACCVAEAIQCLFHPSDPLCGGSNLSATGGVAQLASAVGKAAGRYFGTVTDLGRLYVLRDVLRSTPGGRGTVALYAVHQAELKRLLLADPALRERAIDVLTAWRPVIDEVIGQPEAATTISAAQMAELESFLAELRVVASPGLRAAIDRESQALDLDSIAGLSADQGLQRLNKLTCSPDPTTLCLSGGRIRVETEWETADGKRGSGRAVALTGDTGTFWFFAAANVETIVKVVDACTYNDRRWVFVAGLTDVGVVTTVTDTVTGAVRTYRNPIGRRFAPVQDTNALDCTP